MILSFFLMTAMAASPSSEGRFTSVVDDLTVETILVRAGLPDKCKIDPNYMTFAGAQLERAYAEDLAMLKPEDLTVKNWQAQNADKCEQDCTCSALSKIYERYPKPVRAQISNKSVEASLAKMTDKSYEQCLAKFKNFCSLPQVTGFIKDLLKNKISE